MAHKEDVVAEWRSSASLLVKSWLTDEPAESIQRLDGIQSLVDELMGAVEEAAFHAVFELPGRRSTLWIGGLAARSDADGVRTARPSEGAPSPLQRQ